MTFCPRCGSDGHATCDRGGPLDPPRFCPSCGRRLEVQVLPDGYTSRCRACDAKEPAAVAAQPGQLRDDPAGR